MKKSLMQSLTRSSLCLGMAACRPATRLVIGSEGTWKLSGEGTRNVLAGSGTYAVGRSGYVKTLLTAAGAVLGGGTVKLGSVAVKPGGGATKPVGGVGAEW